LTPDKVAEYSTLFGKSGAENGYLSGLVAKQIFERARLPTEVLGRIWNLSDSQGRGALDSTEFVIAMHLLASYKSGAMRGVPNSLPPGLYEAAGRRQPQRVGTGSRPGSGAPQAALPPQFTGFSNARPQSPISRNQVSTPISSQSTGDGWLVTPADKARFDQIFSGLDTSNRGYITGDQAVEFFGNARLPEETLAQIWDLSDINSEGQLDRDEFAVAMFLIRQQRGTKDGRGIIPQSLPPALVPPSRRRQQAAPPQPTAPAFENAPVTQPRSAADDLFGLDVSAPAASSQIPQSTGGSMVTPFTAARSPQQPASPAATFRQFKPSSAFGQSIVPQGTGSSSTPQSRSVPVPNKVSNDLLEDTDPEVSRNLTRETSELANLSNQVGNLSKQTAEIQGTRGQVEQQISQNAQQKREFESRLTQLRSLYEQEVKEVKVLQDQLAASKGDMKRLQQEMAMINGSHQDLSSQHQKVTMDLQADQRENAALKEKMRQLNAEVEQLKPQLEKLKYDARQQKGLVAINKKQLETNEAERDRIQAEIKAAAEEYEAAKQDAAEHARLVESSNKELDQARNASPPAVRSVENVVSPAPSTSSNPFFRKNTDSTFSPFSPSSPEPTAQPVDDRQRNFDSIFDPSFPGAAPTASAPDTTFRNETPPARRDLSSSRTDSSEIPDVTEPPSVPKAAQVTSAALPFREPLERADSITSSTMVAPPTSRLSPANTPRAVTPIAASSPFTHVKGADDSDDSYERVSTPRQTSPPTLSAPNAEALEPNSTANILGPATPDMGVPGAFPETATPEPEASGHHSMAAAFGAGGATLAAGAAIAAGTVHHQDKEVETSKGVEPSKGFEPQGAEVPKEANFDDIFGGPAHQRTPSQQVADFDSAFADMNKPATNGSRKVANEEFPDIKELDGEESDDSEAPLGFDDDFNSKSPPRPLKSTEESVSAGKQPEVAAALPRYLGVPRPGLETASSTASSLPGVDSQVSPPTYNDSVPNDDGSQFPAEYKGLLPKREDPTSPSMPTVGGSANPMSPLSSALPPSYGPGVDSPRGVGENKVMDTGKGRASPFDFDSAFAGIGAAPVEEDSEDDDGDTAIPTHGHAPEFDPTFGSPAQSRSTTAASNLPPTSASSVYSSVTNGPSQVTPQTGSTATNDFYNFGNSSPSAPRTESSMQTPAATGSTAAPSASHDWDSLFSGISAPPPATDFPGSSSGVAESRDFSAPVTKITSQAAVAPIVPTPSPPTLTHPVAAERPKIGRAITAGTEHDDPILKRLTAMGWSRDESLKALEKYDYNIDKVGHSAVLHIHSC
jgi:epidermal growth factor receptor substrate 15